MIHKQEKHCNSTLSLFNLTAITTFTLLAHYMTKWQNERPLNHSDKKQSGPDSPLLVLVKSWNGLKWSSRVTSVTRRKKQSLGVLTKSKFTIPWRMRALQSGIHGRRVILKLTVAWWDVLERVCQPNTRAKSLAVGLENLPSCMPDAKLLGPSASIPHKGTWSLLAKERVSESPCLLMVNFCSTYHTQTTWTFCCSIIPECISRSL